MLFNDIAQAFVTLIVIMDPFVSLPVLLSITKGNTEKERDAMANQAILIAGILLFIFYISSTKIFDLLGITLSSFMVAGGIVLLLLGVQGALGISFKQSKESRGAHVAAVVIGTPLITGPGVITTVIVLAETKGMLITGIAAALALLVTWLVLRRANAIYKFVGIQTIEVFSRIMGLMVTAIAIEFIAKGTLRIITG